MRRYWQYKQRWRQISGFRRWLLPVVLIGALLFRGMAMAEESRKPDFSSLSVPDYATMAPITINYPLTPPLSGKITSGFGYRLHPVTGERDFHTGIDIAAAVGTPVVASLPCIVTEVGYDGIYGNYVRMSHGTNIETRYCHCSEILVEEGSQLREGERIALSGSTGMTTGAHLHFEVLADGLLADPASVLEVHHDA